MELANEVETSKIWKHVDAWFQKQGLWCFGSSSSAQRAVAEYIANQQGLTLYENKARKEPSLTDFPETGTYCSVCKEKQYRTPGGPTCTNGHGGADPLEEINERKNTNNSAGMCCGDWPFCLCSDL